MTRPLEMTPGPDLPASDSLIAIDRAMGDLRRGLPVAIAAGSGGASLLVLSAEAVTDERLRQMSPGVGLALTQRRAKVLGLPDGSGPVMVLYPQAGFSPEDIQALADPTSPPHHAVLHDVRLDDGSPGVVAAVQLAKLARLLPAVLVCGVQAVPTGLSVVQPADVLAYQTHAADSLRIVSQARVPLKDAEQARIVAFRPADGGIEHLAIVIGEPDGEQPVLARLHSECFTGDLLGSLRCDCGDQLRGAIAEIAQAGSGVLLYLAQEGRGIGLVNKLRAYGLQDQGFDTLDANGQLGFDDDERLYLPAARMLRLLGIGSVRLMTNNPYKVEALAAHGIRVSERVAHIFPANGHNEHYLRTKATKGGHIF